MHDHAPREIAIDHLASGKYTVAGDDPVEFALFKETKIEKAVEQGNL
jgi:hypothetical protein